MPEMKKVDPDIAPSLRRFRRYGRPRLPAGQVFDYGPFDHDGNPKEPWEAEVDIGDERNVASDEPPPRRTRRET